MSGHELFDQAAAEAAEHPAGVRAYQLPTYFVKFLRAYFQPDFPKLISDLERLCWVGEDGPSTRDQNLQAMEIFRLGDQRKEISDLPKLLVRRGAVLDQTVGLSAGQKMVRPIAQDRHEFGTAGSLTILAMSRSLDESELLAFEVFEVIRHFRQDLRRRLCLLKLNVTQIGEVGSLRDFPDFFIVPVGIEYVYRDNVDVFEDKFPFRELAVRVSLD
ncbi:MAG: hypothetical protein KatS3mg109_0028 [Pirellulaceae bacterium]|nr:MAG: hypothetical protein KatS3mg109_0028 [Pirellulaceae bacterium]